MKMVPLPVPAEINFHLVDFLGKFIGGGDREPLRTLWVHNAAAVLPFIFSELNVVEENEKTGACQFMKISGLRHIVGLVYRELHCYKYTKGGQKKKALKRRGMIFTGFHAGYITCVMIYYISLQQCQPLQKKTCN
jgi:hypothetical protein